MALPVHPRTGSAAGIVARRNCGLLGRLKDLLTPSEAPIPPLHPCPKRRRRPVSHLDARR
jgi:hypothetical protein